MTSRNWIWTIFELPDGQDINDDEHVREFIEETIPNDDRVSYTVGQREQCPDTGRMHLQLYIEYREPVRFTRLIRQCGLPRGCGHAERRRGTAAEAIGYCSKDDTRDCGPFSFGVPSAGQGRPPHKPYDWSGCDLQFSDYFVKSLCEECALEYCKQTKQYVVNVTVNNFY